MRSRSLAFMFGWVLVLSNCVLADGIAVEATDETPTEPLSNPSPAKCQPRYISGFGDDDIFTLFFEDRANNSQICYIETTDGIDGLPETATATDIEDTHFCIKDWPVTINGKEYAYRAWAAMLNTPKHNFYVSNDLTNWTLVNEFEIPTLSGIPGGKVYYCFHDVIRLNGKYYAWGECNIGYTLICRSANGADDWEAFACVGGLHDLSNVGPLKLSATGTPTGSFFELGGNRGYGKLMIAGDDAAISLAINTAAKPDLPAAELEAAFIDPDNWTWHDGTTDYPAPSILEATPEHDYCECWLIPDDTTAWYIIYDGDFGEGVGKGLGYAILSLPLPEIECAIDIKPDSYPNAVNLRSKGVLPVAIFSSEDFDATAIDPQSVTLAGAEIATHGKSKEQMIHQSDINSDGRDDLLVQFRIQDLDPQQLQEGSATLTGQSYAGQCIRGRDDVTLVPKSK